MNATQLDHHSIRVTWRAPKHLNGPLLNYRVSLTPPEPPQMFITRHTNFTAVLDFRPGVKYTFYVSAAEGVLWAVCVGEVVDCAVGYVLFCVEYVLISS